MHSSSYFVPTPKQLKVLFIGTYVPKECGIATFTHDLLNSVYGEYNDIQCEVIALNNVSEIYNYPEEVVFQIERDKIEDYYHAVDYINQSNADIVCLQHEFGLFGGGRRRLHFRSSVRNK